MNRAEKAQFIDDVRGSFAEAPFVVLADFKGSTVVQIDQLRRAAEAAGARFRVVKNTLARIALADTDKEVLSEHLRGNTGVVFSGEDPIAAAKMLRDQVKSNDKILVKIGYFEGDVLDASAVNAVADLPSREELLVTLLRTVQEGPRQVLGVVSGPARDLLTLLHNHAANLSE